MIKRDNISRWGKTYDIMGDYQCFPSCAFHRGAEVVMLKEKIKKYDTEIAEMHKNSRDT